MENDNLSKGVTSFQRRPVAARAAILWIFVAAWAVFIFAMSSITGDSIKSGDGLFAQIFQNLRAFQVAIVGSGIDLLSPFLHFMEYFILAALLSFALRQHVSIRRAFLVAIIVACAYGILDEVHQYFVPGRDCSPLDLFVDVLAASFASLIAYYFQSR